MLWVLLVVFVFVVATVLAVFFLWGGGGTEFVDIKKRLSLLELRTIARDDIPQVLKDEMLSDVPAINVILSKLNFAVRIDKNLKQADLDIKVGTFLLVSAALFAAGVVIGVFMHWPFPVLLAVGVLLSGVPTLVVRVKRRRRLKRFMSHFPDALEMFARSLRAGHSFTGAIQLVAQEMPDPIAPEFQKVFDDQNLGIPLRQALVGMTDRVDSLDVKFFVTAIMIQRETGGNLAEIIDKISYVIRERFRIQGQLRTYTAQARLTGGILAVLPIGVGILLAMLNPNYMKPLWSESVGRVLIGIAVVMQIAGMLVIRRIIRIKI